MTVEVFEVSQYEPVFEVCEDINPELGNKKVGQRAQAILNYEVIEKTKSFTILRITGIYLVPTRRKF